MTAKVMTAFISMPVWLQLTSHTGRLHGCISAAWGLLGFFEGFVEADVWVLPGALDVVLHTRKARHAVTQELIGNKQRPADGRCADYQRSQWQVVGHRQGHQQLGINPIIGHIQGAIEFKIARRPGQGDWLASNEHAVISYQQSLDPVITQTFAEQVREVQTQAPANRVEVQQTEY